MSEEVTPGTLPEWTEAQQEKDFAALKMSSKMTNKARFVAADIVARVVPMGIQGVEAGINERVALLSFAAGKSGAQIQVLRRVGSRWTPDHREACKDTIIDWSAIRLACNKTPSPGNALDPVVVLVALAQEQDTISEADYRSAYEAAVLESLPTEDAPPEPTLNFDDLVEEGAPVVSEPSPLDDLIAEIGAVSGNAKQSDVTAAEHTASELLVWMQGASALVAKYQLVRDLPVGQPVRKALVAFIAGLVRDCQIHPAEIVNEVVMGGPSDS